jgi:hypothetical protein
VVVAKQEPLAKERIDFEAGRETFISEDLYLGTFRWVAKRLNAEGTKPPKITHSSVPVSAEGFMNMYYEGLYKKLPVPEMIIYSGRNRSLSEVMETVAHESAHACLSTLNTAPGEARHAEEGVARIVGCIAYAAFANISDDNASIANTLIDAALSVIQSQLVELSIVRIGKDIRPGILVKLPTIVDTLESMDYIIRLAIEIGEETEKDPVAYSMEKLAAKRMQCVLRKEPDERGLVEKEIGYDIEVKALVDRSEKALEGIGMSMAHIRGEGIFARLERVDDFMHYIWAYLGKE